jgi:hypothetical protein
MLICALKTDNRSAHSNIEAKGGTAFNSKGKKYGENCPYASYVNKGEVNIYLRAGTA